MTEEVTKNKRVALDLSMEEAATILSVLAYSLEELMMLCAIIHKHGDKRLVDPMGIMVAWLSTMMNTLTTDGKYVSSTEEGSTQPLDLLEECKDRLLVLQQFQDYGARLLGSNVESLTNSMITNTTSTTKH